MVVTVLIDIKDKTWEVIKDMTYINSSETNTSKTASFAPHNKYMYLSLILYCFIVLSFVLALFDN